MSTIVITLGIGLFSLFSLGVFSESTLSAAKRLLATSDFESVTNAAILPQKFIENSGNIDFKKRFAMQGSSTFLCTLSATQYEQLTKLSSIEQEDLEVGSRYVHTLIFSGDEDADKTIHILTNARYGKVQCANIEQSSLFYVDIPRSISE